MKEKWNLVKNILETRNTNKNTSSNSFHRMKFEEMEDAIYEEEEMDIDLNS